MRPREDFQSDQQYKRYELAVLYANKIQDYMNNDYLIYDKIRHKFIEVDIEIPIDEKWFGIRFESLILLSFSWGDDDTKPWIEDTIENIIKTFSRYSIINKNDIKSLIRT